MKKITAARIYSGDGKVWTDKVIVVDDRGTILRIDPTHEHDPASIQHMPGVLTPGFINAHCHLELSHMKGSIPTGTGLLRFITQVVSQRNFPQDEIDDAIEQADIEMRQAGIVAVGDICNKADTTSVKMASDIRYHSFIEVFDFMQPPLAADHFKAALEVWKNQSSAPKDNKSIVPHAPYSVSNALMGLINDFNQTGQSISVHNQETLDENLLFQDGSGEFIPLWESFGFSMDSYTPPGMSAHEHFRNLLRQDQKLLFVHNTLTTQAEIEATMQWNPDTYWVSCPNANLYIEGVLPNYRAFIDVGAKVCLGTDSLTSNWQLSILEEMKTISERHPDIPFETLITWACHNGAAALGWGDELGVLKENTSPGIIHIDISTETFHLDPSTQVERLA